MKGVGDRMKRAMDQRGFSTEAVARRLEVNKKTFTNYLSDISEPKFETLLAFCEIVGVDIGEIIRREDDGPMNMQLEAEDAAFVKINVYDVELAAGDGRIAPGEEPASQLAFRAAWLNREGINPAHASIVHVAGDSMEPTLANGGIVMIDHRDRTPIAKRYVFALRQGEHLLVKRVERSEDGSVLMLHSDNPIVPTQALTGADLEGTEIIGRVVWSARSWPA